MPARSPVGASGSSGSAAPGSRRTRSSRAPGEAEVGGWDRVRTPYLDGSTGSSSSSRPSRSCRTAGRSSSRPRTVAGSTGRRGPRSSPSSSRLQPSIVVSGAHGKTTTAAMIAFVLDRLGRDPAFVIGGDVPQLGGNARAGRAGSWSRATSPTGPVESLRPEIAVVLNVDLDHHTEFGSRAEVEAMFDRWLAQRAEGRSRRDARAGRRSSSRCPASTTAGTPRPRSPRSSSPACRGGGGAGARRVRRRRAALPARRRGRGRPRRRRLRAQSAPKSRRPSRRRASGRRRPRRGDPRRRPLPAASVLPDACTLARARHRSRRGRRGRRHDVYRAREEPVEGVSGKLVVDAVLDATAGHARRLRARRSRTPSRSSPRGPGPATSS